MDSKPQDEEIHRLITETKRSFEEKFDHYFKTTVDRWNPVIKKGKKCAKVDSLGNLEKIVKQVSRYGVLVSKILDGTQIFVVTVSCSGGEFRLVTHYMGFKATLRQKALELDSVATGLVITRHAVYRWLERNKSKDILMALKVLGESIQMANVNLALLAYKENVSPFGLIEIQEPCSDGGCAVLVIENPEEENYRFMKWACVTYITSDMVKWWNKEAMSAEFPNLGKRNFSGYLAYR